MKAPVSIMPPRRTDLPGLPRERAAVPVVEGPPLRTFPEDASPWESVRLRVLALRDDLRDPDQRQALGLLAALAGLLIFSYWPGLLNAHASWSNPQYSHGWLVPLFSIGMLFWWRQPVPPVTASARWTGLCLLVASFGLRLFVARYRIITIDMYTFVPALAGATLLCGGWRTFRWACLPIGFLIFMYPLPDEATRYLLGPLQTLATAVSTFGIQTLGVDAFREGNRIIVGDNHLGVVDACSGLRMLTIFVALSAAIVMLGQGDWLENIVILASSVPIALIVNSLRITVTGVMYMLSPELAEKLFHDWAGYFMMPLALGMLYFEQQLLSWLFVARHPPSLTLSSAMLDSRRVPVGPARRHQGPVPVVAMFRQQSSAETVRKGRV